MSSTGDVIIATSRMGLAGSRGGGAIPQPAQAGVWRFAVDPSCAIGLCGYVVPTSPLIMFAAASQSVEEVTITPDDHLYVAVVDDRWSTRPPASVVCGRAGPTVRRSSRSASWAPISCATS